MSHTLLVNPFTPEEILHSLNEHGFSPLVVEPCRTIAPPLGGHPDMQFFIMGTILFYRKDLPSSLKECIQHHSPTLEFYPCNAIPTDPYPGDVVCNILHTGRHIFCNISSADIAIMQKAADLSIPVVAINQGYAACTTLVVDNKTIITHDLPLHQKAEELGYCSLFLEAEDIELPGYRYGFIGGSSFTHGGTCYFSGSLDQHIWGRKVIDFLHARKKKVAYLSSNRLMDLGGFILLKE